MMETLRNRVVLDSIAAANFSARSGETPIPEVADISSSST